MRRNLIANYVGTAFSAAAQVLVLPLYVHALGEEQWGLLAAMMALSGVLLAFEAGVSLSVARSYVGLYKFDDPFLRFKYLESRYLYVSCCLLIASAVALLSLDGWSWYGAPSAAFAWAAAMAATQIMGSLYRSILIGKADQIALNALLITFAVLRHAAAVGAAFIFNSVTSVVCALTCVLAVEALARRRRVTLLFSGMPVNNNASSSSQGTRPKSASTAFLIAAGAIGAVGTQIDRIALTAFIDAATLGHYAIAASLSLGALLVAYPISSALIPRLGQFQYQSGHSKTPAKAYALLIGVFTAVWTGASAFAIFGLEWWLRNPTIADEVRPLFLVHLMGSTLNAMCIPNYMRLLSDHRDREIAGTALLTLIVQLAVIAFLGSSQGALAGSVSWVVENAVLLLTYSVLQKKR